MLPLEREAFGKMLMTIGQLYNKQINAALVQLYWKALECFTWNEVRNAFELHIIDADTGQFMPKPADIIRALDGNIETKRLQAWTKVEQAIRLIGPYRSVVFDDPIIHAVLGEMGGWIKICKTSLKELPFVAKEFQTRFGAYRYKAPSSYPRSLIGLAEHHNQQTGIKAEEPILLGDKTRAQNVLNQDKVKILPFRKLTNENELGGGEIV